ncbi:hypothetical protein RB653_005111 [Dictyostelium firmibasis]|uniref:Alpha-galactosidase n=1 Tax=Dictyostelium firmibasis TaxID=79012 RepID=A0AAN7UBS7_9MYCE
MRLLILLILIIFLSKSNSVFIKQKQNQIPKTNNPYKLSNGLALTPPMGFNYWNFDGCETNLINETMMMNTAYAMSTNGMARVGYEYVNLDDCWMAKSRDENGNLLPDPIRFPSGIKHLADYIHSLGLKFGIYGDIGTTTCKGYPGSENYLEQDAKTFAEWGVDFVKMDGCNMQVEDMKEAYTDLGKYLQATGRPMVYSCSWPTYAYVENITMPFDYIEGICNLWREFQDIRDDFTEWTQILDEMEDSLPKRSQFAGPSHFNDPDMLEIGNGLESNIEYKSMISLWSIIAAPLIAGNDILTMSKETLEILINEEVIQVNQDPLGLQGNRVYQNQGLEVYQRTLINDSYAIAMFNRGDVQSDITITSDMLNLTNHQNFNIRDLWSHTDNGTFSDTFTASVEPHGTIMIKLSPKINNIYLPLKYRKHLLK